MINRKTRVEYIDRISKRFIDFLAGGTLFPETVRKDAPGNEGTSQKGLSGIDFPGVPQRPGAPSFPDMWPVKPGLTSYVETFGLAGKGIATTSTHVQSSGNVWKRSSRWMVDFCTRKFGRNTRSAPAKHDGIIGHTRVLETDSNGFVRA